MGREPAWTSVVAAPVVREAALDVAPAELGDPGVVERLRHRVRLRQFGRAWLRLDGPLLSEGTGGPIDDEEAMDELMPALGETASRIRVVTEEDGVRVAVWVERRDAWETALAPVRLDTGAGGAGGAGSAWLGGVAGAAAAGEGAAAGVWLEAGAPLRVMRGPVGGRREIELREHAVLARGTVPAALVGHVWLVPHDDRTETAMADRCPTEDWKPPPDPRPKMVIDADAVIRAAAAAEAPAIATVQLPYDVAVLGKRAEWVQIELRLQYARIRGYVPASALTEPEDDVSLAGRCGLRGFGMSHADRIEVPAGTCLFDRANGDVVGVAIETKIRLGARARSGSEWSLVYVGTRWSQASLYVHDTGRDPARPGLESCAARRHRR